MREPSAMAVSTTLSAALLEIATAMWHRLVGIARSRAAISCHAPIARSACGFFHCRRAGQAAMPIARFAPTVVVAKTAAPPVILAAASSASVVCATMRAAPEVFCASEASERRYCMKPCDGDSDCRTGYQCVATGTSGAVPVAYRDSDGNISQNEARYCAPPK